MIILEKGKEVWLDKRIPISHRVKGELAKPTSDCLVNYQSFHKLCLSLTLLAKLNITL